MTKSILAKQPDGTIQLTITIPKGEIQKAYNDALEETVRETELPGFRKGRAPKKLVEEKVDRSKVYEQVLQKVVPQAYLQAIEEHKLKPIITPKVELIKAKEDEDWEIRATTCELPGFTLGNYKDDVRKATAASKLWVPNQPKVTTGDKQSESTAEERTEKAIAALLQAIRFDLPQILIEDEVDRSLSNLINQTNSLGLTIDQYLTSIGKTAEQLRTEYNEKVSRNLRLQFILDRIAVEEKFEVSAKEIDDLVNATGDPKTKESLSSPVQKAYLKGLLARRKVLDFLEKLE